MFRSSRVLALAGPCLLGALLIGSRVPVPAYPEASAEDEVPELAAAGAAEDPAAAPLAPPPYGDILLMEDEAILDLRAETALLEELLRLQLGAALPELIPADRWFLAEDLWLRLESLPFQDEGWTRVRVRVGDFREELEIARAEALLAALALHLEAHLSAAELLADAADVADADVAESAHAPELAAPPEFFDEAWLAGVYSSEPVVVSSPSGWTPNWGRQEVWIEPAAASWSSEPVVQQVVVEVVHCGCWSCRWPHHGFGWSAWWHWKHQWHGKHHWKHHGYFTHGWWHPWWGGSSWWWDDPWGSKSQCLAVQVDVDVQVDVNVPSPSAPAERTPPVAEAPGRRLLSRPAPVRSVPVREVEARPVRPVPVAAAWPRSVPTRGVFPSGSVLREAPRSAIPSAPILRGGTTSVNPAPRPSLPSIGTSRPVISQPAPRIIAPAPRTPSAVPAPAPRPTMQPSSTPRASTSVPRSTAPVSAPRASTPAPRASSPSTTPARSTPSSRASSNRSAPSSTPAATSSRTTPSRSSSAATSSSRTSSSRTTSTTTSGSPRGRN